MTQPHSNSLPLPGGAELQPSIVQRHPAHTDIVFELPTHNGGTGLLDYVLSPDVHPEGWRIKDVLEHNARMRGGVVVYTGALSEEARRDNSNLTIRQRRAGYFIIGAIQRIPNN